MAKSEAYTCDVCGRAKEPSNGWFRGMTSAANVFFICRWKDTLGFPDFEQHFCSLPCAIKAMTKAVS
jgi:hypothetical protein